MKLSEPSEAKIRMLEINYTLMPEVGAGQGQKQ